MHYSSTGIDKHGRRCLLFDLAWMFRSSHRLGYDREGRLLDRLGHRACCLTMDVLLPQLAGHSGPDVAETTPLLGLSGPARRPLWTRSALTTCLAVSHSGPARLYGHHV